MSVWAIIVAAGRAERFGGEVPKQFVEVRGRPLLTWSISRFEACEDIDHIVLVIAEAEMSRVTAEIIDPFGFHKVCKLVPGGQTRHESVRNGLKALPSSATLVAIHDGARPLVSPADISHVVRVAEEHNAAILATPVTDTVKQASEDRITATLDRRTLFLAQTPQVFSYQLLKRAHHEADPSVPATDDAALVERLGEPVRIVVPKHPNPKVTVSDDLRMVATLLEEEAHV